MTLGDGFRGGRSGLWVAESGPPGAAVRTAVAAMVAPGPDPLNRPAPVVGGAGGQRDG